MACYSKAHLKPTKRAQQAIPRHKTHGDGVSGQSVGGVLHLVERYYIWGTYVLVSFELSTDRLEVEKVISATQQSPVSTKRSIGIRSMA